MNSNELYKLTGYLAEQGETFTINIAPNNLVNKMKEQVKEKNPQIECAPKLLQIYKIDENPISIGEPQEDKTGEEKGVPYDGEEQLQQKTTPEAWSHHLDLEGPWSIRKCWRTLPETEERIHFMVVLPDNPVIEGLVKSLRDWRARPDVRNPELGPETLYSLGNSFPLQQCDGILSHLRDQMLYAFRAKFVFEEGWLQQLAIPILGAASGTGKTAICSRFLSFLAHRAIVYGPPSTSVMIPPTPTTNNPPTTCDSPITEIASATESHPPDLLQFKPSFCDDVWTAERFLTFRSKVIKSAEEHLCLRVDLKVRGSNYNNEAWQAVFAADLLLAYASKDGIRAGWRDLDTLVSIFSPFSDPIHLALQVLQVLQTDDIIIIHVDETQHVDRRRLQEIVSVLVSQMQHNLAPTVPWIFPIFSGLSLESLIQAGESTGVKYKRYTPPVLSIQSMRNIISDVIYGIRPQATSSHSEAPSASPNFSKGLIRFLYDLRGPTRIFQVALLMIQSYGCQVEHQAFDRRMGTLVNRGAIREGLENIKEEEWGSIFERLADLMQNNKLCTNLFLLQRDPRLLRRLFHMNFLGESIGVLETFNINGEIAPLSQLFEYGWITTVDTTAEGKCTVFLPFLTLYKASPSDPHALYHPNLTPLCKGIDWRLIEHDDARMLQYRLNREFEENRFDISISEIFGGTEHLDDIRFHLPMLHDFLTLKERAELHQHLHTICKAEKKPTIYLNAEKAKFADSFAFLRSHDDETSHSHILCLQSKFLQSDSSSITYSKVVAEYKKIADVCRSEDCCNYSFTLIILANRIGVQCQNSIANDPSIRSSVLLLDSPTLERFYGKPLAIRRAIFAGLLEEPQLQSSWNFGSIADQHGNKRTREGLSTPQAKKKRR